MNNSIQNLYNIASKEERHIIGLMSGTSMDGLDIAHCVCKGAGKETQIELLNFITIPYQNDFRADVKSVFSKKDADLEKVTLLNELIGIKHAEMILEALRIWGVAAKNIDVIASHGQTIFHAPKSLHGKEDYPNATLQIGDGDHIAFNTGIITLSDFRQKHLAAGGEGAPLAVYGDYFLFSKADENRIMLNIGGISNFTYLPGDKDAAKVFSTDVGPGNTIMDQFVQNNFEGKFYDKNGEIASTGLINDDLLMALLADPFFKLDFPKTTGPELFNLDYLKKAQERSNTISISNADVLATLSHFTAQSIAEAIKKAIKLSAMPKILMSGGGMRNTFLTSLLAAALPQADFTTTEEVGINPDAKEAVLFALLANETLAGNPIDFGKRKGVPSVCMGKICLPI